MVSLGSGCNYYSETYYALKEKHTVIFKHGHIKNLKTLGNEFDLILLGFGYTNCGYKAPLKVINDSNTPVGVFLNKEYGALNKKLEWLQIMKPSFVLTVHHSFKEIEKKINIPKIYKNVRIWENGKFVNGGGVMLPGIEYAKKISNSKIFVATTSPADLISTRYFECMATNKALIITNRMNEKVFEKYLIEDFNCVMFDTLEEFYEKVNYYLKNEDKRMKIVNNAYNYFIENLTWRKSIEKMETIFNNYVK